MVIIIQNDLSHISTCMAQFSNSDSYFVGFYFIEMFKSSFNTVVVCDVSLTI